MDLLSPVLFFMMLQSVCMEDTVGGMDRETRRSGKKRPPPPKEDLQSSTSIVSKLLHYYNRQEAPMKDRPTEVQLGVYIVSFFGISEGTMDYSVSMYLRQAWRDPRLSYVPPNNGMKEIRMGMGRWKDIWIPDTFFRNEKRAYYHDITVDNRLLKLNATGHLWYVSKISATLSCPMMLQKYPMDTQTCPIMFESFGYTMDTMYFAWLSAPVDVDPSVELPQFTMEDKILHDCSQNYTAGAFPCLEISFVLRRDIGFFLIQVYVPSMLIVILSWVAFWLNIDAIPARVTLGLLTVLTMTTQSTGAQGSLPRVSYIKAIDVWMSMCLIFVFTALLEFAVVNVMSRKEVRTIKTKDQINLVAENGSERDRKEPPKRVDPAGKHKARAIDKTSRKLFPIMFLIFGVVYWTYYSVPGLAGDH